MTFRQCLRSGAEDVAIIPVAAERVPVRWRPCASEPRARDVHALGFGLTERGLPTELMAARLAVAPEGSAWRGSWRARRRGVAVRPGDSGGPVSITDPEHTRGAEICFVVSALESSSTAASLLQPVWDLERRLGVTPDRPARR
jgi:hypothetical protein